MGLATVHPEQARSPFALWRAVDRRGMSQVGGGHLVVLSAKENVEILLVRIDHDPGLLPGSTAVGRAQELERNATGRHGPGVLDREIGSPDNEKTALHYG